MGDKNLIKLQNKGWEEVKLPMLPSFIMRPSDGFPIPIQELSDAQLKKIGKMWTNALVEKANSRKCEQ